MAAAAAAARGPMALLVSNTGAQWLVLGAGMYYFSPDHVRDSVHRGLLAATAASGPPQQQQQTQQGPLILRMDHHTSGAMMNHHNGGDGGGSWVGTVFKITLLVGGVWVSYIVITNIVPDQIAQLLPVTKSALSAATEQLASSLLKIKNVLGHEIKKLQSKQDQLQALQHDTKKSVDTVQDSVVDMGNELQNTHDAVQRCEHSLEQTQAMQAYTGRGVKLLATAVSSILKPEDLITQELNHYIRAGDLLFKNTNNNSNNNTRRNQHQGPEEDRPQLSRSTSSNTTTTKSPQVLLPNSGGNGNELDDIKSGRWNANHSIMTPAM